MAFIGMDGAEHKIRQLTSQLQSKDAELASVRNELIKKSEVLAEEVKAKQALRYQMEQDSRGIETSSKDTNSLKNEVSILRQNLINRETALSAANDTIKKLEKANQGLEYELQCAGSNSDESSRRLLEQKNKLDTEVKSLKQELQRRDNEDIRTKAANAKVAAESSMQPPSGIPRLKRPASRTSNTNFFGSAPTPSPGPSKIPQISTAASASNGGRRRSISLSNTREIELQSKVSALEIQLAGTRTKLDKAENQIMAVQRSTKKHADDIERKLDEANDELEFYRSQGGNGGGKGPSAGKAEMEQLKKSRDALKGTVEGLMVDLEAARGEIEVLKTRMETMDRAQEDKDALRSTSHIEVTTSEPSVSSEEAESLRTRISTLESDLAKAQSGTAEPTDEDDLQILSGLRKEIRKLKKELSLTQHMVAEAEKERDEFEEELEALKVAGGGKGKKGLVDEADLVSAKEALEGAERRVRELEVELEEMRVAAGTERAERQAKMAELRTEIEVSQAALHSAQSTLETTQTSLSAKEAELLISTEASSSLQSSHNALAANLQSAQFETERKERELADCRLELESAQQAVSTLQSSLDAVQTRADDAESQLAELVEVENLLIAARAEVDHLKSALGQMEALEFGARQERDQARKERDEVLERIKVVEADILAAEQERRHAIQDAEHERATVQATRSELEDSKKRLASRLLEIEEYSDQLQIAATDIGKLEQRNAELEEGLANRSTESEAQHRQEEVFQLKEDLERLRGDYEAKEMELAAKGKEVEASTAKIAELEAVLTAARLASDAATTQPPLEQPTHANLLHAKIENLRIERDELRQTMSFSKHEHRFAIQAAEADRASAVEELHRAKSDLKQRVLETEKVQAELSSHREQLHTLSAELDSLRGQMAEASTAKSDTLDQQILQLQSELEESKADRENMRESSVGFFTRHHALQAELDTSTARYTELTNHFQALQGQYSDVQRRVAEAEKSRAVALAERDECLEKLDGMRTAELPAKSLAASTGSMSVVVGELSAAEARMKRDMRRSSLMAFQDHAALEQAKKLELVEARLKEEREKVVAEQERVKRREGSIRGLLQRIEKAEFSAQLARDDSDEKAEELQAAAEATRQKHEEQVAELHAEITAGVDALAAAKAELEHAQASLAESEATAEALRSDIARSIAEADTLSAQLAEAQSAVLSAETKLALASAASAASHKSGSVLILTLANIHSSSLVAQTTLNSQSERIISLETEFSDAQSRLSSLQAKHDALLVASRSADQAIGQEAAGLRDERDLLQGQIGNLEERCKGLEGELETLMLDSGAAEEAHQAQLGEKGIEVQNLRAELETAGDREAEAKDKLAQAESALAGVMEERDEAKKEMGLLREKEGQMGERLIELEQSLAEVEAGHVAELTALREELEVEKRTAKEAQLDMATKVDQLQVALSAAEEKHAEEVNERVVELDTLRAELATQRGLTEEKEQEAKMKLAGLEAAISALSQEKAAAQAGMEVEKSASAEREEGLRMKLVEVESALAALLEEKEGEPDANINANAEIVELRLSVERTTVEISELTNALDLANRTLATLRADTERSTIEHASRVAEVEALESRLADSETALEVALSERVEVENRLNGEIQHLSEKIRMSGEAEVGLRARAEGAELRVVEVEAGKSEMEMRLSEAVGMADMGKQAALALKEDLGKLEIQLSEAEAKVSQSQEEFSALSKKMDEARVELLGVQAELTSATTRLGEKEAELDIVQGKNTDLATLLAQTSAPVNPENIEALEHQLQELQIICSAKDADVDMATDHMTAAVVEKNKALVKIGKLERKILKLEKAISTAAATAEKEETARNTAANLLLMKPRAAEMAPPPIPVSRSGSVASTPTSTTRTTPSSVPIAPLPHPHPHPHHSTHSTPSSPPSANRQPLRSVNVFDKSQIPTSFSFSTPSDQTPKTGNKRMRDGAEDDGSKLPAEAIMQPLLGPSPSPVLLPPVQLPPGSARKPVRGGFTPQRNAFAPHSSAKETKENSRPIVVVGNGGHGGGVSGSVGVERKGNVFAESTPRRNPFAVDQ